MEFVTTFLNSTTPISTSEASVCTKKLTTEAGIEYEGQLLLNPEVYLASVGVAASSELAIETDDVFTEYGFYFQGLQGDDLGLGRRLKSEHTPLTAVGKRLQKQKAAGPRRSLQEEDDYLVLF